MTPDEYLIKEMERMGREMERLRADVRNPTPPYVSQEVYETSRTAQGERIGLIEETLRTINRTAWTALVLPVVVGIAIAVITTLIK